MSLCEPRKQKCFVRKKIRFALSENRVNALVDTIKRLTEGLRTLTEQTEPLKERHGVSYTTTSTKHRIAKFRAVKSAAENLYQALGHACTKHAEHRAHLSLQPSHNDASQIQFTIAFSQSGSNGVLEDPYTAQPLWLTVESLVTGTIQYGAENSEVPKLTTGRKHPRDPSPTPISTMKSACLISTETVKKVKKRVTFEPLLQPCSLSDDRRNLDSLTNFCDNSNFCTQIRRIIQQPILGTNHCIGYLSCSHSSKHLVYLNSRIQSISTSPSREMALVSLRQLFDNVYRASLPTGGLLQHERIQLAKQLATAVLHFHSTPWLDKSWSSNNVLIFGLDRHDQSPDVATDGSEFITSSPYLNVSIGGPQHGHDRTQRSDAVVVGGGPTRSSRTLVRNQALFAWGVMMLELAYQRPPSSMRKPRDMIQPNNDVVTTGDTDYFTADRIRHQASAYLGPRYAEAARKCIQCDFGRGSDLSDTRLQEGFYQDVICELDVLEKRFSEFRLSI